MLLVRFLTAAASNDHENNREALCSVSPYRDIGDISRWLALKVPAEPQIAGFRRMEEEHCASACELLNSYLTQFALHPVYSIEDFKHWLMPCDGVMNTYVVANGAGRVTDLCSFYKLPATICKHPDYDTLFTAYSYYNVATTVTLTELMSDAVVMAKKLGFDVMNALDCMDNTEFFSELKFTPGNGVLRHLS